MLVYAEYAKTSNYFAVALYAIALIAGQTLQIVCLTPTLPSLPQIWKPGPVQHEALTHLQGGSVWLKQWSEANGSAGHNPNVGKYIGIYFGLGIGSSVLVVMQTLILWIFCSIEVSTNAQSGIVQGEKQED